MKLVIDTNVFISALIKDSKTRRLIKEIRANLLFPEYEFEELKEHKLEIIKKSLLTEREFNILFLKLLKYVNIIPDYIIEEYKEEAFNIMGRIDEKDVQFIATALAFNCSIWSDDKHFKKQDKVKILTTNEMRIL